MSGLKALTHKARRREGKRLMARDLGETENGKEKIENGDTEGVVGCWNVARWKERSFGSLPLDCARDKRSLRMTILVG